MSSSCLLASSFWCAGRSCMHPVQSVNSKLASGIKSKLADRLNHRAHGSIFQPPCFREQKHRFCILLLDSLHVFQRCFSSPFRNLLRCCIGHLPSHLMQHLRSCRVHALLMSRMSCQKRCPSGHSACIPSSAHHLARLFGLDCYLVATFIQHVQVKFDAKTSSLRCVAY